MQMRLAFPRFVVAAVLFTAACSAKERDGGALLICGGGGLPEVIQDRFLQLAGGERAKLVVVPTASSGIRPTDEIVKLWGERGFAFVTVRHTRDRDEAAEDAFLEPFREATAVWISGGSQGRLADAYAAGPVEQALQALVERGGVVGGSSAGAAIQSRVMIRGGNPEPEIGRGFDLAADVVIDQHFLARNRFNRLLAVLRERPDRIGVGIDERTAIELRGDSAEVLGESFVVVVAPASGDKALSVATYSDGDRFRLSRAPQGG